MIAIIIAIAITIAIAIINIIAINIIAKHTMAINIIAITNNSLRHVMRASGRSASVSVQNTYTYT